MDINKKMDTDKKVTFVDDAGVVITREAFIRLCIPFKINVPTNDLNKMQAVLSNILSVDKSKIRLMVAACTNSHLFPDLTNVELLNNDFVINLKINGYLELLISKSEAQDSERVCQTSYSSKMEWLKGFYELLEDRIRRQTNMCDRMKLTYAYL